MFPKDGTDAADCVNEGNGMGEIELSTEPRDVHVDQVVEGRRSPALLPDVAGQHFTRHDLPAMTGQVVEQLELADREDDRLAGARHPSRQPIDLQVADVEAKRRGFSRLGPPQESPTRAETSASANGLTR